ncbi:hypothetical protein PEC18_19675 [Paucibacter sp. O1-1]|nr:hypothetical protein [Paucibacter sp. O1-1]MDA3827991.1 hypothetical protein [Paucibacter sp. O1-1]
MFFKGPNSFTGEDVLELQGHGGQNCARYANKTRHGSRRHSYCQTR